MGTRIVTADEARKNFAELLNSATYGQDRIRIERRGKVAGFIIGPKDMELLESAAGCPVAEAGGEPAAGSAATEEESISWDELKEEL